MLNEQGTLDINARIRTVIDDRVIDNNSWKSYFKIYYSRLCSMKYVE